MVEFGGQPQSQHQPEEVDRPRGILSPRDRRYLLGEANIESNSQAERNVRAAIRERLENAILDFTLLFQHIQDRDRKQTFDNLMGERPPQDTDYIVIPEGVIHTIALLYLEHRNTEEFASSIMSALREVADKRDEYRSIEVSIEFEPGRDIEDLENRLEGGELAIQDIGQLYKDNQISLESLIEIAGEPGLDEAMREDE